MRIGVYGYNPADIVVMLDGGQVEDSNLAPTRANIASIILWIYGDLSKAILWWFAVERNPEPSTGR